MAETAYGEQLRIPGVVPMGTIRVTLWIHPDGRTDPQLEVRAPDGSLIALEVGPHCGDPEAGCEQAISLLTEGVMAYPGPFDT